MLQEQIGPPYIAVRHSLGSLIIRYVANRYSEEIIYPLPGIFERFNGVIMHPMIAKLICNIGFIFVNGDIGFSVSSEMMPAPHGPHAKDQAERAAWLIASCKGCFARPEFIGWHMCGIIDTWKTMPGKDKAQHQGLMTIHGEFYPEMEKAVIVVNLLTSPEYLWFIWPIIGWGVGLVIHAFSVFSNFWRD